MEIKSRLLKTGFSINLQKNFKIEYPRAVWESISKETKKTIAENIIYLKTSPYSLFLEEEIHYNFSVPYMRRLADKGMELDIPRIAEEDNISSKELIEKFKKRKIRFKYNYTKKIKNISTEGSSIVSISFGKDSLLSYAIAKELNLNPKLVLVQDFWDLEAYHKLRLVKKFKKEFKEKISIVYDYIDDISTHKRINKTNSKGIVATNAMSSYMAILLPFAIYNKSEYIIFGNEQNFNDYFTNKEGFNVYPSHEQNSNWMLEQSKSLRGFTNNKIRLCSLVEPLYNIAEIKVLFNRYPAIAKYQMSCSQEIGNKKSRWCYNCPMCAKAFLYLVANNINPKIIDFKINFFNKEYKRLYPLFNKPFRIYEKPKAVRDEQLLAFYLAYRNKKNGYLIKKFKENFLAEAKEREDELYNRFFKIHTAVSIPKKIKTQVKSIYKEELNK